MRRICKRFGGVQAVDDVTVDLYPGEVVGVLGHNGAGKSTLITMLAGAYPADSGEIYINGEKVEIATPRDARRHGIETIYQTLALAEIGRAHVCTPVPNAHHVYRLLLEQKQNKQK